MINALDHTLAEETAPFKNGLEHLQAELRPIRLLLAERTAEFTRRFETAPDGPFRGYGITPAEALSHLQKAEDDKEENKSALNPELAAGLATRVERSGREAVPLPLVTLQRVFSLSRFEVDILLTCLLPELYPGLCKVFGFLQDDATQTYPATGFLLDLYCHNQEERSIARQVFHPGSPLKNWDLLAPIGDEAISPLLKRAFRVDERIVTYLLGNQQYDERLSGIISMTEPGLPAQPPRHATELKHLVDGVMATEGRIVTLAGKDTDGIQEFIEATAATLGWKIISTPLALLHRQNEWNTKLTGLLLREAVLQPAVLVLHDADRRSGEPLPDALPLKRLLARKGVLVFYLGTGLSFGDHGFETRVRHIQLDFPAPGAAERVQSWMAAIEKFNLPWTEQTAEQLAMNYRIPQSRISVVLQHLRLRLNGSARDPEHSLDLLRQLMSEYLRQPLDEVAKRIEPAFGWEDLILPRTVTDHLRAYRNMIAHQFTVYEKWRLGSKMPRGRGAVALFSGSSGTGKTMAAEVIARDLGINLYRIDLAGLVSKYIGETEKNIKKVFDNAGSNTLLFFDEADSLFGRRTEIKDSHDRYANLEVNYLLQRLEDHDGPVVLATNIRKNLDEAFLRRIHFIIEFPQPSDSLRRIIFQKYLPSTMPLAEDIDLDFLAEHFEISGGDIKNAAVQAAFMAAENGGQLVMEHLLVALKREYLKIGKLYPGSQVSHLMKTPPDSPENRRRAKEAGRFGS